MDFNSINLNAFLEFPGILITIGVGLLLISIILIIIVYISENKMRSIKASALDNQYGYNQDINLNDQNVPNNEEDSNNLNIIEPIEPVVFPKEEKEEPVSEDNEDNDTIDAFENEFNSPSENIPKEVITPVSENKFNIVNTSPVIPETEEEDEEEIELL